MVGKFFEILAVTVFLFLEWIKQMKLSRAMGGWIVVVGLLMALFFIGAAAGIESGDIANDADEDAARMTCAVGAVIGILMFTVGAWRYAKKD